MTENNNTKQLDSYSALISSKYFEKTQDYINLICVNSKFKETTEKLRFNPIPINSLKLFPNIQTQYLYSDKDTKILKICKYEIWYNINYDQYLKFKEHNIKFRCIVYTHENRLQYGDIIPKEVNILGENCFSRSYPFANNANIKKIDILSNVIALGSGCFNKCLTLSSINLPSSLTSLGDKCFYGCSTLSTINLPSSLKKIGKRCFSECSTLSTISLPLSLSSLGNGCFSYCSTLSTINLPSSLSSLGDYCFYRCSSLSIINLPPSLTSIGDWCFDKCSKLSRIDLPSSVTSLGNDCFYGCSTLSSINIPFSLTSFGKSCFYECPKLKGFINVPDYCFDKPFWMREFN